MKNFLKLSPKIPFLGVKTPQNFILEAKIPNFPLLGGFFYREVFLRYLDAPRFFHQRDIKSTNLYGLWQKLY